MKAKRRRCAVDGCDTLFWPRNGFHVTCSQPCAYIWSKTKEAQKVAQRARKAESAEFRKRVQGNDLSRQHKLTRDQFNRMRVLEELKWFAEQGIEPYCISCRKTKRTWSCGHFKTIGHQGNLRYDPNNTFLQCWWSCNKNLSGNIEGNKNSVGYKRGLILRFGQVEGDRIIDYCETHTAPRKWTCDELKTLRAECAARIRELESLTQLTV